MIESVARAWRSSKGKYRLVEANSNCAPRGLVALVDTTRKPRGRRVQLIEIRSKQAKKLKESRLLDARVNKSSQNNAEDTQCTGSAEPLLQI